MKKTLLALVASASLLLAGECSYQAKSIDIDWKAYKTPLKIGVGGKFDTVKLQAKSAASPSKLLESAKVTIQTASINSKNSARDAKLVKFFFDVQNIKEIHAEVLSVDKNIVTVAISMNGITKNIPMKLELKEDEIEAKGTIDLADFSMLPSLKSINKACYELHKGKTWQDVSLEFEIELQKNCD